METESEFLNRIELLNLDHDPDGFPAVQMQDLNRLREIITELHREEKWKFSRLVMLTEIFNLVVDRIREWESKVECKHTTAVFIAHGYACKECGKKL